MDDDAELRAVLALSAREASQPVQDDDLARALAASLQETRPAYYAPPPPTGTPNASPPAPFFRRPKPKPPAAAADSRTTLSPAARRDVPGCRPRLGTVSRGARCGRTRPLPNVTG